MGDDDCPRMTIDDSGAVCAVDADSLLSIFPSWTAESDQVGAWFSHSVASAGDVNGDGYDDVIVGAPLYDNGETDEGRASLYLGSSSGLSAMPSWTAESDQVDAAFGWSVASAGDVNGDDFDDVVVMAPQYDNGEMDEGRVYLYSGSSLGLSATSSWIAEGNQVDAGFGWSAASAGDVNNDGYDDVVVGAPSYDNGEMSEGRAYLYLGSASGLSATPSWTAESGQAAAGFGGSVASAGDVNNDGFDDVVVGAAGYDNGETDEGRAFLYLGSASGLSSTPSWTSEGNQANAGFGWSVASAGDVDNDGFDDVVVGAPQCGTREGRAHLYLGSASGLSSTPSWTVDGIFSDSWFGRSVASAGDVNGDGYDDVVVGAPGYDHGEAAEGCAYLYLGSALGLSATYSWTVEGNKIAAQFGVSVASAGDVNDDGFADVVVGANHYDNGELGEGRAYLFMDHNSLPTADAGTNLNAIVGDVATFNGSKSSDDALIENYTWNFTYDDRAWRLYGVSPTFTFDIAGTYIVTLTVKDAEGITDADTVTITVEEESFIESYGLALGIVVALVIVALVLFFVLKGRKGGMAPTSLEEVPAGGPEVHSEGLRS
ncbi:MAG: FG-GAP-like repeat-containing protein [Thermoplasmata archaeon]|nr:FG-GAP-like repeat-containing protein [Thermoplasmata archaeon]